MCVCMCVCALCTCVLILYTVCMLVKYACVCLLCIYLPIHVVLSTYFAIRLCYVTNDGLHVKNQFIKELNRSYKQGNLLCNFTEKEVTEFFQYKNADSCPVKKPALYPGRQIDGTWVLDGETYINARGEEITIAETNYIWIQHLVAETVQGIHSEPFFVAKPLAVEPLKHMIMSLMDCMNHNSCAALVALAAGALTLHYETIRDVLSNFPVPVLYGPPGTGKTTALRCVMAALGAPQHIYSKVTNASIRATLSNSSIPVGFDDPSSKKDTEEIVVQLYNGEFVHTLAHGMQIPRAGIIVTSNFPLNTSARCVSHSIQLTVIYGIKMNISTYRVCVI